MDINFLAHLLEKIYFWGGNANIPANMKIKRKTVGTAIDWNAKLPPDEEDDDEGPASQFVIDALGFDPDIMYHSGLGNDALKNKKSMKALSIKQPWVHAILHEGKNIENRTWSRTFRGWLAIHASGQPSRDATFPRGVCVPDLKTLQYSAICGVARVVDIVPKSRSKWFDRPDDGSVNYGWVLAGVIPLKKPIVCKGALGLWDVPPKIFREIQRQLLKLELDDA